MRRTHRALLVAPVAVAAAAAACRPPAGGASGPARPDSALVGADVRYLASDALEGRGTGTPGNDSAARYLARRYVSLGIAPGTKAPLAAKPACESRGVPAADCLAPYLQAFTARSVAAAHAGRPAELPSANVAAFIPGRDPALRGQVVVIGAHFDHLGRSTFGALDGDKPDEIRNGADDNASGTAAVLELGRLLHAHPTRRSVALVHFTAEELGLLGSQYFVEHSPFPLDSVQAMLNFDMVGRLRNDKLLVYGVATASELPDVVKRANTAPVLAISAIGDGFGPSDQSSFYAKNVPVLHFFTDLHDDYHKATDDADKISAGGIARVVALAERIVRDLGDRDGRLTFVRSAAPVASSSSSRTGSQAYLGSIPDMAASDVPGLRLSGVRPGSPADNAGLKAGDLIIELGGTPVKDLYTYSDALYSHAPGDTVDIVVKRGAERVTVKVTLGKRG
jgi:hypothetical protein